MADFDEWIEESSVPAVQNVVPSQTFSRGRRGRGNFNRNGNNGGASNSNWRTGEAMRDRQGGGPSREFGNSRTITVPTDKVGRIIGRGGAKINDLQYESNSKIKIGEKIGDETNIVISGNDEDITKAEELINDLVDYKPREKNNSQYSNGSADAPKNYMIKNEDGVEIMDWDKLNADYEQAKLDKWSKLPPIVKDFYHEHPEVASMPVEDVVRWRKENFDIQVQVFGDASKVRPIPNPVMTFEQAFKDYPEILEEIYKQNFTKPSPIQSQAWPILLRGDDMIGIAQTGTGKTLAFLLPALIHIDGQTVPREERSGPTVLILAPTRELALQIEKEVKKYSYKGIKAVCIYGGGDRKEQITTVGKGVDIVIATPGRLNDLVVARHLSAINFSYIVLDEADRMLDMGFEPQIRKSLFDVRPDRQTVMTSATWPPGITRLAKLYMQDPIQVNVGSLDLATVHSVTQRLMFVEEDEKDSILMEFIQNMDPNDKVIVFCGKKATANDIYSNLCIKGINCQALHGDREQSDREAALGDMVDGTVNILIATDVASRGIDIADLTHVINLDFPRHMEEYVHRVGRTGRAGKTGIALSFITRQDWAHARELINILREADQDVPDELEQMAERFEAMKLRREREGSGGGRGRGGRGGGGRGGGRFGGRDREDRFEREFNRWN